MRETFLSILGRSGSGDNRGRGGGEVQGRSGSPFGSLSPLQSLHVEGNEILTSSIGTELPVEGLSRARLRRDPRRRRWRRRRSSDDGLPFSQSFPSPSTTGRRTGRRRMLLPMLLMLVLHRSHALLHRGRLLVVQGER